jgi:hypothetical protein
MSFNICTTANPKATGQTLSKTNIFRVDPKVQKELY